MSSTVDKVDTIHKSKIACDVSNPHHPLTSQWLQYWNIFSGDLRQADRSYWQGQCGQDSESSEDGTC